MDGYYQRQSQLPYFGGHIRQRGSGIGALVLGVGRIALPFIRKVIIPAAKRLGRDLLTDALPEVLDVVTKKKTAKQALKSTVQKTVRKQIGGGKKQKRKRGKSISSRDTAKRSRLDFFSKVKNDY